MAFTPSSTNAGAATKRPAGSQASEQYYAAAARAPWIDRPAALQGISAAAQSPIYQLAGEDYISVIIGGASAATGVIWGSHDCEHWVSAQTISAAGETVMQKCYGFVQVAIDTITGSGDVAILLVKD